MSSKKRLYEVFSKVNRLNLNEQFENREEWDEFTDDVKQEVKTFFSRNNKMFKEGVLNEINVNTQDFGDIELKLYSENDSTGIEVHEYGEKEANNEYVEYIAEYRGEVNNVPISILIFFDVTIEQSYQGDKVVFYTNTFINDDEIEIEFNVK